MNACRYIMYVISSVHLLDLSALTWFTTHLHTILIMGTMY